MFKLPEEYLKHVLDEINYLISTTENLSEEKFSQDQTFQRAFTRSLEIIGEAVKNLPLEFRTQNNSIDWKSITGMRDRLIHGYFGVDYQIVWDVIKNEIPKFKPQIEQLITKTPS
ncbi:MAG: DUF86 domain-containing protein [bacterium]